MEAIKWLYFGWIWKLNCLIKTKNKNKLLWLLEGQVLSQSELESLIEICTKDNKLTIVFEMGGSRKLEWKPLSDYILDEFES